MARVALYGRVSSHSQDKSESIQTQKHYLEEWARASEHEVVSWYGDEDVQSSVPVADRPEGGRLLRDAGRGRFDLVAIYHLSRWSRYTDVWHEGKRALEKCGVRLVCAGEELREERPGERFSLGVRLLVNEYERDNIATMSLDGKYRRAKEGGYVGGVVPFGYRVTGDRARTLAIDEEEAEVVRMVFGWIVEDRISCLAAARRLNELKIPTACARDSGGRHRPTRGAPLGVWHSGRVVEMVRHPIYKGETLYGRSGKRGAVEQRVPAIVDPALWEAAQRQVDRNRNDSMRNTKRTYLLRGLVRCVECGRTLFGRTETSGRKEFAYYVCPGRQQPPHGRGECPLPWIRAAELESDLWQKLVALIEQRETTVAALREQMVAGERRSAGLRATRDGLRGAIAKKRAAIDKAIARELEGAITLEEMTRHRDRLLAEIAGLEAELALRDREAEELVARERRLVEVRDWLGVWRDHLHGDLPAARRREIIDRFVDRVELRAEGEEVRVRHVFYFDAEAVTTGVEIARSIPGSSSQGRLWLPVEGAIARRAA